METVRYYRENLKGFNVTYKESDLYIKAEKILKTEAFASVFKHREVIEQYIFFNPDFFSSLTPIQIKGDEPKIIMEMKKAGILANVGPFASVAGVLAEKVALDLNRFSEEVVVENGGDVFLAGKKDKIVRISGKFRANLALKIEKKELPVAVCSSSSKIGHSLSLGNADLVTVVAQKGGIADAFATAICNEVRNKNDIEKVIEKYCNNNEIKGVLIFFKNKIAGWGNLNIIKIEE
jgi:ApbE superfamily uncharacterized protein (UPF0280 family)